MNRGAHSPSGAGGRQTGWGRKGLRRYGAAAPAFNAMRRERPGSFLRHAPLLGRFLSAIALTVIFVPFSAAARVPVILDFGDSITAGYGLPAGQAFPVRLETWLHEHGIAARVVNAGVSSDTTAGGLARLDWALADKPDLVILALGANDALRGIEPSAVRDNLDKMIRKVEVAGAKVLLIGMLAPPNWGAEYETEFDRIFPELAKVHDVPLYPFFLEGVAMKPEFNQPDGLHPNERGVAVLVDRLAPVVARLVASPS